VFKEGIPCHFKALAVRAYKEQSNELVNINSDFMVIIIIMTKIKLVMVINVFIFN